jgi:uncharacterized membrane protein
MDKTAFWTVFRADLLFSLCSITVGMALTLLVALWRKRKLKRQAGSTVKVGPPLQGPRMFTVGGVEPSPGHCPLCGRDWPLSGPQVPVPTGREMP